jgi:gliding motility-associated-like protein
LTTAAGCDSIVTLDLTITPIISTTQSVQICPGQSYLLPDGTLVSTAGVYIDTLTTYLGCDSVITTNLSKYAQITIQSIPEMSLCSNDSISFSLLGNFDQVEWSNGQTGNLIMINEAGNYQVVVTDSNGCVDSTSFIVNELQLSNISVSLGDSSICLGDCIKITALGNNLNQLSWSINGSLNGNGETIEYCFKDSGIYNIKISSVQECGISYDSLTVNIYEPEVFIPLDTLLQIGDSLNLWSIGNYSDFWWQPNYLVTCDNCENQKVLVNNNQRFTFYYTDSKGCVFSKSFLASINKEGAIFIPNTFTPNGDNVNDVFYAYGRGIIDFNMKIFDRLGELIFESDELEKGWDGSYFERQVQQDVYTYVVEYKGYNNEIQIERGFVALLR